MGKKLSAIHIVILIGAILFVGNLYATGYFSFSWMSQLFAIISPGGGDMIPSQPVTPIVTPVCGNDILESGEECDGSALGGKSCSDFEFDSGYITCLDDCSGFDTSGCVLIAADEEEETKEEPEDATPGSMEDETEGTPGSMEDEPKEETPEETCTDECSPVDKLWCAGDTSIYKCIEGDDECLDKKEFSCGEGNECKDDRCISITVDSTKEVCTADDRKCDGNNAEICSSDGSEWKTEDCSYKCENGVCVEPACETEGGGVCIGNVLKICSEKKWATKICDYGCDEETLTCKLQPTCTDTDNGAILDIWGTTRGVDETGEFGIDTKGDYVTKKDECAPECLCFEGEECPPCEITEYFCMGHFIKGEERDCEYGCRNGSCVPAENVMVRLLKNLGDSFQSLTDAFYGFFGISE